MKLRIISLSCIFVLLLSCGNRQPKTQRTIGQDDNMMALRSRSLIQIFDSFSVAFPFDTIAATLRLDTAISGQQILRIIIPSIVPYTVGEKQQLGAIGANESELLTNDDYVGFFPLRYDERTIFMLVAKGTLNDIPSDIVDTSLLWAMDSLMWRPTNYKEEFYDAKIHRYRINHIARERVSEETHDSIAILFDGYEYAIL